MAAWPRSAVARSRSAGSVLSFARMSSRLSTSVSTRLTKNDATDSRCCSEPVAARRRSTPSRKASITASYRSREKINVTLMLIPSARHWLIAGSPSTVAGILTNRFGRSTSHHSARASAMVFAVSCAIRGSTSIEIRPSTPSLASKTGRSTSHADRTSIVVIARSASPTSTPRRARSRSWLS